MAESLSKKGAHIMNVKVEKSIILLKNFCHKQEWCADCEYGHVLDITNGERTTQRFQCGIKTALANILYETPTRTVKTQPEDLE